MNTLYNSDYFRVSTCDDCFIPGHLVIHPLTPVPCLTHLSKPALENIGPVLALCYEALEAILQPARIYTLSFCEVLQSLHFHVFPRTALLGQQFNALHNISADSVNGALFFDWARKICQEKSPDYELVQEKLRREFDK